MAKKKKEGVAVEEEQLTNEQAQEVIEDTQEVSEEISKEEQLQEELGKEKDKFLRLFAEFENYKKRTSKERVELFKTAGQDVIQSLLPILDDFDRAITEISKTDTDSEAFKGVELISNKLKNVLDQKGLKAVEAKSGDVFDADVHDAITQIPAPSEDLKGKIIDVIEKGYTLGDKVIRHPKVVVGQ